MIDKRRFKKRKKLNQLIFRNQLVPLDSLSHCTHPDMTTILFSSTMTGFFYIFDIYLLHS